MMTHASGWLKSTDFHLYPSTTSRVNLPPRALTLQESAAVCQQLFAAAGALDKNPKVVGPRSVKFLKFSVQVLEAEVGA